MIQRSTAVSRSPVFYGWIVWAVATLGIIATSPGQAFTVSLFLDHYIVDFNLDRTTVSTLLGIGTFIAAISLTWVGRMIDRYGSRRFGTAIIAIFALGLVSFSFISGPFMLFYSFFATRLLGQGGMFLVSSTAIAQWWRVRRGWMIGLSLVGFALFQNVYLRNLQTIMDTYGWRTTWVILGVTVGIVALPVWWMLMRNTPEDYGLQPDGNIRTPTTQKLEEVHWTLAQARRKPIFWVFISGRMFTGAFGTAMIIHQVSILTLQGHPQTLVASVYGTLALVNAIATLGVGRIISYLRPGRVMSFQITIMMITLVLITHMSEIWMVQLWTVLFGIIMAIGGNFEGTVWADLFGREHIGSIRGFSTTMLIIGASVGPILFGWSYDTFGNYIPIVIFALLVGIVPASLALLVNRPIPSRG